MAQTLEQQRAAKAWADVKQIKDLHDVDADKKYSSLVRKMPPRILTNGLGQSLAFLRSKGKTDQHDEHNVLYRHLSAWVMRAAPGDLLEKIRAANTDSATYRYLTAETLAYLNWLKRFVEAELKAD